ncbi:MAG: dihydroorotate dehydrogenase [Patescibacteria group bacterium]|nr:dihydroorotate dehydrogenase [Patescibacteria group bacterium]MDD5715542.1 dihydroorotate dehydrogenase [Patescibacteria group bacterium]
MSLRVQFAGLTLKNPTLLASGVLGVSRSSIKNVLQHGAAGCVIKSISLEERKGHAAPNMLTFEGGMLNAVGYSNPGVDEAKKEFEKLRDLDGTVIASIVGKDEHEFAEMAERLLPGEFSAVELALSCPHTPGYGTLAGQNSPENTESITRAVREKTKLPLFVKLSPNSSAIADVARAAEAGGADGITATNTMGPGMVIDIQTGQPILDFKMGGVSGPALRPIAVRCIYDIYKAVRIPIIGCGGITYGRDAIEMMMVGASAVEIGTGVYYRGIDVFKKVCREIESFMEINRYASPKDFIGRTHKLEEV